MYETFIFIFISALAVKLQQEVGPYSYKLAAPAYLSKEWKKYIYSVSCKS